MALKKNIKTIIISILLALVVFSCLLAVEGAIFAGYEMKDVVVIKKEIPKGMEINKKNAPEYLDTIRVMKEAVTKDTITSIKDTYGNYVTNSELGAGKILYKSDITTVDKEIAFMENPVEISASLASFADGVSGTLRKGDMVYVFLTDKTTGETQSLMMDPIYIKESFTSAGELILPGDKTSVASVFTFVVDDDIKKEFCELIKTKDLMLVKYEK